MKKLLIFLLLGLIGLNFSSAQEKIKKPFPKVGEPMPDHLFTDLVNYPAKSVKISDFKGKWLILDTWDHGCAGCLASFPKMNELDKRFKDKVKLIMVGLSEQHGPEYPTKKMRQTNHEAFTRLNKKHDLKFTVAYDTVFNDKYGIRWRPTIFIVNPEGILYAITGEVNEYLIGDLVAGNRVKFTQANSAADPFGKEKYNSQLPLLTKGRSANGGTDTSYLYRSLLTEDNGKVSGYQNIDLSDPKNFKLNCIEALRFKIPDLYQLAYFGDNYKSHPNDSVGATRYFNSAPYFTMYMNTKDSSKFDANKRYCYSLKVPAEKASPQYLMKIMQDDLENYFGFRAKIEKRASPVYYLKIIDSVKFKKRMTTSQTQSTALINGKYDGYKFRKYSFNELVLMVNTMLYNLSTNEPKVYKGNDPGFEVDLDFEANLLSKKAIEAELLNHGLKLVKAERQTDALILMASIDSSDSK